jgi:predicted nucleotidyltransferase
MSTVLQPVWAVTPEKIREAVQRIVEAARPQRVIVFGSQARGNCHPDSDLDVLVILAHVAQPAAESVRLRRLLKGLLMGVDVLVVSRERFEYWCDTPGHLFFDVKREGTVAYQAP